MRGEGKEELLRIGRQKAISKNGREKRRKKRSTFGLQEKLPQKEGGEGREYNHRMGYLEKENRPFGMKSARPSYCCNFNRRGKREPNCQMMGRRSSGKDSISHTKRIGRWAR